MTKLRQNREAPGVQQAPPLTPPAPRQRVVYVVADHSGEIREGHRCELWARLRISSLPGWTLYRWELRTAADRRDLRRALPAGIGPGWPGVLQWYRSTERRLFGGCELSARQLRRRLVRLTADRLCQYRADDRSVTFATVFGRLDPFPGIEWGPA